MKCRFCGNNLEHVFIDLVGSPPSNSFLRAEQLNEPEPYFPLKVFVCGECFLVQVDEHKKSSEIFSEDYVYFSSISTTWLDHSRRYVEMITPRLKLDRPDALVIEIASNDGYLLQYFKEKKIPCLGIEPTTSTAAVARGKGIDVIEDFFGVRLAGELSQNGRTADLILGNNVLAHVPDINDFVEGLKIALKPSGTVTMEFPHLMRLVENNQFDTIYHEHFSYLSFSTVRSIFSAQGLTLYDVEELPTHGGSIRIYARHKDNGALPESPAVRALLAAEKKSGMGSMEYYLGFQKRALHAKMQFLDFLLREKKAGKKIAAYGAAAKGNTLLNYCGIKNDLIDFVVDAAPSKQGKYLPGCHIPVVKEERIRQDRPDYVIILPWNIKKEVMDQIGYIREWGGKFVIAIPELEVI